MTSAEEYFSTLDSLLESPQLLPSQTQLAENYFYFMMFLYQQKLPTRYSKEGVFKGYSAARFEALPANEPLVEICNQLTSGLPVDFVDWPDPNA